MPIGFNAVTSATILIGCFGALLSGLLFLQRRCAPPAEVLRKLLHVGMGSAALSLPWLFASVAPVLVLTGVFVLMLLGLRAWPALRARVGGPIHGVNRNSFGEIYFALGVGLLFVLSFGNPLLFCIPMLILTLADAAAGLAGHYFGRLRFSAIKEEKSVEGSLAFFVVAFLITQTALLRFSDLNSAISLLIALALGLSVTLVEALAGNGFDNLLIPLAAFFFLKMDIRMGPLGLAVHLSVAALFVLIAMGWVLNKHAVRLGFLPAEQRARYGTSVQVHSRAVRAERGVARGRFGIIAAETSRLPAPRP